jgi:hypothetical protein
MLPEADKKAVGVYSQPIKALEEGRRNWDQMTNGLSAEEMADFERAKADLELYERIHEIFDYSS